MSQKLSRRDLLKLIAAATNATILSSVPNKWTTPIVEFGALPAHAQGSARGSANINITVGSTDRPTKKAVHRKGIVKRSPIFLTARIPCISTKHLIMATVTLPP